MRNNVTSNDILKSRNQVFIENGIPALLSNGFEKSPYKTSWYGKEPFGFAYEHCKLFSNSNIIHISTHIIRGDNWIQNYINVFQLQPEIKNLSQLENLEATKFGLPPLVKTRLRLKLDGYNLIPLFVEIFVKQHKLGKFNSKQGFELRLKELGEIINEDLQNIDYFIDLWYKKHKPTLTDWEGNLI